MLKTGEPHVLILDEGFASGTITALGLRDAGCRVTVLGCNGGTGRAQSERLRWYLAPAVRDPLLPAHLDAAVTRLRPDVVYPITEPLQQLVWRSWPTWSDLLFPQITPFRRALLASKRVLSEWVSGPGLNVPAERSVEDAAIEPVVVKGVRGRGGSTTTIAATVEAARAAVAGLEARGIEPIVQEYIGGPTFLAGGLFDAGRPVRLYAGEKVAQYPARTGPAARIRSVSDPPLVEAAVRLLSALRWSGLASADFIRRPTGEFVFLELNPRPWGSISAAAVAGVELFGPLRELMAHGHPAPDLKFEQGADFAVMPLALLAPIGHFGGPAFPPIGEHIRNSINAFILNPTESTHIVLRAVRGLNQMRD